MIWVLVILMAGSTDGGRAINAELRFESESACEQAGEKIRQRTARAPGYTPMNPDTVCVQQLK